MFTVLVDKKYHDETELLSNDLVLINMTSVLSAKVNIDQIPYSVIDLNYKRFGGKHNVLTIGSYHRAMKRIREKLQSL